jgi:ABC-2 type transport system ATP-binding protein
MTSRHVIRAEGLTKRFGDFTAVDHLRLDVEEGSIYAFLGANGSGKSTTIRMLIGLLTPTEGTIEVDGVDVIATPRRVRDHIGYMGQKVSLYQGLTLRENVEFYAGLFGLAGATLEERWRMLRERFALGDVEESRSEDLPAGIRQRAGLALATLHRPRILFLDEPTAGVDVESRALFWERIREEADSGVTIFVTTHFMEEAEFCDRVSFIDRGRLVADASPEELRARYSYGYRLRLQPGREEIARELRAFGVELETENGALAGTLSGSIARLEPGLLDALHRCADRGVEVGIEPAPMTEVFRRMLSDAGSAS